MNLVGGDRRPPKQRQSYMGECAALGSSRRPVLSFHQSVVCGRTAKRDPVPLVIRPRARKGAASGDKALEVVDVRRFQTRSGWLIMTAIPVEPRNRVGFGTAVRHHRGLSSLLGGSTISHIGHARKRQ